MPALNARMRRIDLLCKLLGPLTISFIATASTLVAIWATLAMSTLAVFIEYFCIASVRWPGRGCLALDEPWTVLTL